MRWGRSGAWRLGALVLIMGCGEGGFVLPGNLQPDAWVWGDLHAHSGWSYDSCEDPEHQCAARPGGPAHDFFDNALADDLDFAALTDHAEADWLLPAGEGGDEWAVWSGQQEVVLDAQEGPVLPILGYEWTAFRGDTLEGRPRGGHRTVLLADPEACEAMRVPGYALPGGVKEVERGNALYLQDPEPAVSNTGELLWGALDAAQERCGPSRWLSFVHHPAYLTPQQTDWMLAENAPLRETLVEIYSEHGSSECWDISREGCDFALNEAQGYYPDGAVQRALDQGYRLGFLAGTDSHDARPGSLADGPGTVGNWTDSDGDGVRDDVMRHFGAGGLTGVYLPGPLEVDGLLDALEARSTVATSGPRPTIAAWVLGRKGGSFLPGESVPEGSFPVDVRLRIEEPASGWVQVELVGAAGKVIDASEGSTFSTRWEGAAGDWAYLRVRYFDEDELGEVVEQDRLWISPWWVDLPEEGCACTSASGSGSGSRGLVLLGLLGLFARRRREEPAPSASPRLGPAPTESLDSFGCAMGPTSLG